MAKFDSTAFTRVYDSFGNLTVYHANGIDILKKKVTKIKNPRTLGQLKQRCRFVVINNLAYALERAIAIGLAGKPVEMSVVNYFAHINKDAVRVTDELEPEVVFSNLLVAKGNRAMPDEITLTHDVEKGSFTLAMEMDEFLPHAAADDQFYCCAYEKAKGRCRLISLGERAKLDSLTFNLPDKWDVAPENLAFYVFCVSKDHKRAGTSVYVTVE